MTKEEFILECRSVFELNFLPCTEKQAEMLFLLTERMLEVNKSLNLTAIKEEKAIILKHYVDSLTISKYIPDNSRIIDVGCGAGFPTLPLAVFRHDLSNLKWHLRLISKVLLSDAFLANHLCFLLRNYSFQRNPKRLFYCVRIVRAQNYSYVFQFHV